MKISARYILAISAPFLIYLLFKTLTPQFALPFSISLSAAIFWFFEIIPLSITAILIPASALILGVLSLEKIISVIFGEIITILAAIITISYALQKHNCEKLIVAKILNSKLATTSLNRIVTTIACACFFVSMWISNTAACAMFLPVMLGIINQVEPTLSNHQKIKALRCHILLLCTYTASLGGLATPIGSPPNLIAMDFLTHQEFKITFLDWMVFMLPLALIIMFLAFLVLKLLCPIPVELNNIKINYQYLELRYNTSQKTVLSFFVLALLCWILPELFSGDFFKLLQRYSRYPINFLALILFILKDKSCDTPKTLLTFKDLKKIEWRAILIFIGGICLGHILTDSGAARFIIHSVKSNGMSLEIFFGVVSGISVALSEFISNTASASILIPMLYEFIKEQSSNISYYIMALIIFTSMGFMLPTSTVPNTLVYATGKIRLADMIKIGVILDFTAWLTVFIVLRVFLGL